MTPEAEARKNIDRMLTAAGWQVQDRDAMHITAAPGVAIREFKVKDRDGVLRDSVDYMLYADARAIGVVEAKPEGHTLTGVELQSAKYRALIVALRDADPAKLLEYTGSVVSTFCEIAAEQHDSLSAPQWPPIQNRATAESACLLTLYFGWRVPGKAKSPMFQGSRILLETCSGEQVDASQIRRQSYLDEIDLLLRTVSADKKSHFTRTRLSDQEGLSLEGLGLGGDSLS